jgi:23S rRNA (uridine2552-2'-O)-methyltransferase
MGKKSKSSSRWLKEHFDDPYVKKAQESGFRSRSAFKLQEIQEKYHIIKPGMVVLDIGAAPGGWSQLVKKWVGGNGRVLAVDILPIEPIQDVWILEGDVRDPETLNKVIAEAGSQGVSVILSDIAPNMSGTAVVDQARSMQLVEIVTETADDILQEGGSLAVKVFQGVGFDEWLKDLRGQFKEIKIAKPKASRDRSREVYIVAKGFKKRKKEQD